MINKNTPVSTILRDNWTSLLQLTRAIENVSKDKVSSDEILASLVQMKLAPGLGVEVEKVVSIKDHHPTLQEIFDIVNNIICSHEISEVTRV